MKVKCSGSGCETKIEVRFQMRGTQCAYCKMCATKQPCIYAGCNEICQLKSSKVMKKNNILCIAHTAVHAVDGKFLFLISACNSI